MAGRYVIGVVAAVVLVLAVIIGLVATSLRKLESAEVGLKYDNFQKMLRSEAYYEGLHTGPPGFTFIKFPSVFQTLAFQRVACLNKDGVSIHLSISFQYRIKAPDLFWVATQFKDMDGYDTVLSKTGASAIYDSCSQFNTSQFQSQRGRFQEDLTTRLVRKFEKLDCDVTDIQVNDIERPGGYERAIKDKESAREDIEVATQERPQRVTEAGTKKKEAETGSQIILNQANSDARIALTRAQSQASAILNDYRQEARSYKSLMESNDLNVEGLLSYMGIRAISSASHPVHLNLQSPAKTSYVP